MTGSTNSANQCTNTISRNIFCSLLLILITTSPAYAFWWQTAKTGAKLIQPLIKHSRTVESNTIEELVKMASSPNGTKLVGQRLGELNLPDNIIEDAYLRIALAQNKINRTEAETMIISLKGKPGFRSTVSKVIGNSAVKTSGHLNELRIADNAARNGFNVKGIGVPFNDGLKTSATDIDLLLERNGRLIAIEAKDYLPTTPIPMDKFRADMDSLVEYSKSNPDGRVLKIFSVTHRPGSQQSWLLLNKEAERRDVQLIDGAAPQQILLTKRLMLEVQ